MELLTRLKGLHKDAKKAFLIEHKQQIIAEKSAIPVYRDNAFNSTLFYNGKEGATKDFSSISDDVNAINVKVVMSTAWYCDYHNDVLLPDCWEKSIKENKTRIHHLHDHKQTLEGIIADVKDIYGQTMSLRELGLDIDGKTQALIFESLVKRSYNDKVFTFYKQGKINQHSIGLIYVKLELAINDKEFEEEYAVWQKYYDKIINKDYVDEEGYFFVVKEIKLIEGSAVLLGANEITPTLIIGDGTPEQPPKGTGEEPTKAKGIFASIGIA